MEIVTQAALFDYSQLDTETCATLKTYAVEFSRLTKETAMNLWRMGEILADAQGRLAKCGRYSGGAFSDWLEYETAISKSTAYNLINVYRAFNFPNFGKIEAAASALYLLAAPSTPETARQEAIRRAESGEPITYTTAREIVQSYKQPEPSDDPSLVANIWDMQSDSDPEPEFDRPPPRTGATAYNNHAISDTPGYDGDEWYTPTEYVEAARQAMGGIDLDPASRDEAQGIVEADAYYTKDDDGLTHEWWGRVFLNPPYSMPMIEQFTQKVIDEYDAGRIEQAIVLVNNCTDTKWFHSLLSRFPACFTRGRIPFWRPNHENFGTRQGQAFFYLGNNEAVFVEIFAKFGAVVKRYDDQ